jgi:hypothetical protein
LPPGDSLVQLGGSAVTESPERQDSEARGCGRLEMVGESRHGGARDDSLGEMIRAARVRPAGIAADASRGAGSLSPAHDSEAVQDIRPGTYKSPGRPLLGKAGN